MSAVAKLVGGSEGRSLEVLVLRGGAAVGLAVTPRRWEGLGLLGCRLLPLQL